MGSSAFWHLHIANLACHFLARVRYVLANVSLAGDRQRVPHGALQHWIDAGAWGKSRVPHGEDYRSIGL
jgi:hypothetical protein